MKINSVVYTFGMSGSCVQTFNREAKEEGQQLQDSIKSFKDVNVLNFCLRDITFMLSCKTNL